MSDQATREQGLASRSYAAHEKGYDQYIQDPAKAAHAATWAQDGTVDAWRHARMYVHLDPLVAEFAEGKWLTVGDGRYGSDAHYLLQHGCRHVLATDIGVPLLAQAAAAGFITAYQKENAEALSFGEGQFDCVLCKESYHHFPRPPIALYEMLRVASHCVVLIEPYDTTPPASVKHAAWRLLSLLFAKAGWPALARRLKNGQPPSHGNEFESIGNYVYKLSERELEKVGCALGLPLLAFRKFSDFYLEGGETNPASTDNPVFRQITAMTHRADVLAASGLIDHGLCCAILFKTAPSETLRSSLEQAGFTLSALPKNPYLGSV